MNQPQMDTDETRIRREQLFSSVYIRVHLWLKKEFWN
jgi:hypothetical protein